MAGEDKPLRNGVNLYIHAEFEDDLGNVELYSNTIKVTGVMVSAVKRISDDSAQFRWMSQFNPATLVVLSMMRMETSLSHHNPTKQTKGRQDNQLASRECQFGHQSIYRKTVSDLCGITHQVI